MKPAWVVFAFLCLGVGAWGQAKPTNFTLDAGDDQKVYARLYHATGPVKGVILMFHQARSNMEEYAPIAPRVAKMGFDCLTIDQRSGGNMWGAKNRTAAMYSEPADYLDAYADLEGAFYWALMKKYKKIIAWGSSYSASLTLRLAAQQREISAILLFSPGEYFPEKNEVAGWNKQVRVPAFFAFTKAEATNGGQALYEAAGKYPGRKLDKIFASNNGVHGSSTLREDRNLRGHAMYWSMVTKFLKSLEK